jgi:pimeloyl-ACP methyl ester carboxylesterase
VSPVPHKPVPRLPLSPPGRPPGQFVRVAGRAVHLVLDGPDGVAGDAPVVLLASGLGGCWQGWDLVVPLLSARCRVVRFDRPGLGRSEPAPGRPSLVREVRLMTALLDRLGVGGPVVVAGHSMGGLHAEAFARLCPRRTAGVVLTEAETDRQVGAPRRWPGARVMAARATGGAFRLAGLSQLVAPGLRRLGVRTQSVTGRDPSDSGDTYRSAYGGAHVLTAALVERVLFRDVVAELAVLRGRAGFPSVPLRVLSGPAADVEAKHRKLAAMSPLGRYVQADASLHMMPVDRPGLIADAVLDCVTAARPRAGLGRNAPRRADRPALGRSSPRPHDPGGGDGQDATP